jgi:hypothetical protein
MGNAEDHGGFHPPEDEPQFPTPLPPDVAEFLRTQHVACFLQPTDQGTALVAKVPSAEIASARGTVPIHIRHELYDHPAAPVIRTVLTIYDQPATPLALETYTNVEDPDQRADFAALTAQNRLLLLFYDEQLRHRLNKMVPYRDDGTITTIVAQADQLLAAIPKDRFSFERAKQAVMEATQQ